MITLKKLWLLFTGEERVFIVTKTYRVRAYTANEAMNKVKAMPMLNESYCEWECKAETEDLF